MAEEVIRLGPDTTLAIIPFCTLQLRIKLVQERNEVSQHSNANDRHGEPASGLRKTLNSLKDKTPLNSYVDNLDRPIL